MPKRRLKLKADSYLLKPIKIPELKSALKQAEREISEDQGDRADFFRGKYYVGLYAWSGAPEFTIK